MYDNDERPVFELRYRDGRTYKVYASGHHEGFPEAPNTLTINRIPIYVSAMYSQLKQWESAHGDNTEIGVGSL
jgi:hypothetical protein